MTIATAPLIRETTSSSCSVKTKSDPARADLPGRRSAGCPFPQDELNDAGLRASIEQMRAEVPREALVGGESAPVFDS